MRSSRKDSESGIFHIVSRGAGQQAIFETDADRRRYLDSLGDYLGESSGELLAWCLMDNHVHLLVRTPFDCLSNCMRKLNSSYALYFNIVHGRSGHLFQGRFLSEPVETDEYLVTVVRYIHQNPWKAGMASGCDYRWSSYRAYASGRPPAGSGVVMGLFGSVDRFIDFHNHLTDDECLDISMRPPRVSDDCAREIAGELLGVDAGALKSMPRELRDEGLAKLKRAGLTVRQIQRLTGISLGVISRA